MGGQFALALGGGAAGTCPGVPGFGWKAGGRGRVLGRGLLVRDGVGPTRGRWLRVKCERGREGAGRGHPPDDSSQGDPPGSFCCLLLVELVAALDSSVVLHVF